MQKTTAQDSVKDNPDAAITARTVYTLGPPKTKPTLAWVTQATQVCSDVQKTKSYLVQPARVIKLCLQVQQYS